MRRWAVAAAAAAASVAAYPENLIQPPSVKSARIMGVSGIYAPSIWANSSAGLQITCDDAEGVAVFGDVAVKKASRVVCAESRCYSQNVPEYPLTVTRSRGLVVAICASGYGNLKHWRTAAVEGTVVVDKLGNTSASGKMARVAKTTTVPSLFYTATALAFAGVIAHYAANNWISSDRPQVQYWVRQLHYLFMPASVIVAGVGVEAAVGQNWRVARNSAHAKMGIAVLVLMSVNIVLGVTAKYYRRGRHVAGPLHRLLGGAILVILGAMMITASPYVRDAYASLDSSAHKYAAGVMTALAVIIAVAANVPRKPQPKPKHNAPLNAGLL